MDCDVFNDVYDNIKWNDVWAFFLRLQMIEMSLMMCVSMKMILNLDRVSKTKQTWKATKAFIRAVVWFK